MRAAISSSMAALGLQTQRLAAVRIMAGLTDARVAALHDITNKLFESAAASRWATVAAMASSLQFCKVGQCSDFFHCRGACLLSRLGR